MLDVKALEARRDRLTELAKGLAKEIALWRKGDDPLLYLERKQFLVALGDMVAGVETARLALVQALIRIRGAAVA